MRSGNLVRRRNSVIFEVSGVKFSAVGPKFLNALYVCQDGMIKVVNKNICQHNCIFDFEKHNLIGFNHNGKLDIVSFHGEESVTLLSTILANGTNFKIRVAAGSNSPIITPETLYTNGQLTSLNSPSSVGYKSWMPTSVVFGDVFSVVYNDKKMTIHYHEASDNVYGRCTDKISHGLGSMKPDIKVSSVDTVRSQIFIWVRNFVFFGELA